ERRRLEPARQEARPGARRGGACAKEGLRRSGGGRSVQLHQSSLTDQGGEGCIQVEQGEAVPAGAVSLGSGLASGLLRLGLADGTLLAKLGAAAGLARLLVVLSLSQLLLDAAALQQFLETAQGQSDRFPVMNTHPQGHS